MNELNMRPEDTGRDDLPPDDPLLRRFVDLVRSPGRLMDNVGRRTRLWVPYLAIFVFMTAFLWTVSPIMNPEQLEMSKDSKLMQMIPQDVREQQYEQALHPSPLMRAAQAVQGSLLVIIQTLLLGLLLGLFAKLSGGQGRVVQGMGVVAWSSLVPMVLGPLVTLPIILQTESFFGTTIGLAALLPDADPASLSYKLLYMFGDFFTWWGVALLVIGFRRVYGLGATAAAVTVILVWFLAVLAASAPYLFLM